MSTPLVPPDEELREWITDWQAGAEPAAEVRDAIRRRVKRQSFKMALYAAGEMVFGLSMLAFVIYSAAVRPAPFHLAAMGGLALLILWALAYSLWSLRGTWRPSAETTAAFLNLSILRCQRRLGAVRAGWWLLALELAILIPWLFESLGAGPLAYGLLAVLTVLVTAFLIGTKRQVLGDLQELEQLQKAMDSDEESFPDLRP
jgi:hypothetical protein